MDAEPSPEWVKEILKKIMHTITRKGMVMFRG